MPSFYLSVKVKRPFPAPNCLPLRTAATTSLNKAHFQGPVLNPRHANSTRVSSTASPTLPSEYQLVLRLGF